MVKGAPSINPSGRPKGAAGIARYVAEQTNGGQELVDRLLELSRDTKGPVRERVGATLALLDRLAGRPMQPTEIMMQLEAPVGGGLPREFYSWPEDKRRAFIDAHAVRQLNS